MNHGPRPRQSGCSGFTFVFVGEGMVHGDVPGAGQGGCWQLLGAVKVPQQEQNGVSILMPAPDPLEIAWPCSWGACPLSCAPQPPQGRARGRGVPHTPTAAGGMQERDEFVASGSSQTNFKRHRLISSDELLRNLQLSLLNGSQCHQSSSGRAGIAWDSSVLPYSR